MCSNLLSRPILICHMFYTKINKLFFASVCELTITVTPFTVIFIEFAIGFFAKCFIVKRHSAALANKLSRSS